MPATPYARKSRAWGSGHLFEHIVSRSRHATTSFALPRRASNTTPQVLDGRTELASAINEELRDGDGVSYGWADPHTVDVSSYAVRCVGCLGEPFMHAPLANPRSTSPILSPSRLPRMLSALSSTSTPACALVVAGAGSWPASGGTRRTASR